MPNQYRVFWWVGPLIAINWLSVALMAAPDGAYAYTAWVGYLLGSLFAHTTLTAAWTAFGPGPLVWRVPLSVVWAMTLPVAVGVNPDVRTLDIALTWGAVLFGLWLLLQLPLWALALGFGLHLRHIEQPSEAVQLRFGIRHLMAITLFVSVVLGIGRIAWSMESLYILEGAPILAFLAVAAVIVTLPLLLAALMRRKAVLGVMLSLVLVGVVTAIEEPLIERMVRLGPGTSDFVAINVTSALLILLVAGTLRLNGHCLYAQPATKG